MTNNDINLYWRPAIAEGIATFFFVLIGSGSVIVTGTLSGGEMTVARLTAIAITHGLAIAMLVAAIGHLSGAHINPAVTFAAVITKRIGITQGAMYMVTQLVGGVVAALLIGSLIPAALGGGLGSGAGTLGSHAIAPVITPMQGMVIEIILTSILVFVIFGAAMDKRGAGTIAPLAIGSAVIIAHFVGVPLTGASMNPARTLGPAVAAAAWADHWVYWVGPLVGAAIAGLVYRGLFEKE